MTAAKPHAQSSPARNAIKLRTGVGSDKRQDIAEALHVDAGEELRLCALQPHKADIHGLTQAVSNRWPSSASGSLPDWCKRICNACPVKYGRRHRIARLSDDGHPWLAGISSRRLSMAIAPIRQVQGAARQRPRLREAIVVLSRLARDRCRIVWLVPATAVMLSVPCVSAHMTPSSRRPDGGQSPRLETSTTRGVDSDG